MKYINVKDNLYTDPTVLSNRRGTTHWHPSTPEAYSPNWKEWFIHYVLGKHFTFGQPYCVVCLKEEIKD